MTEEKNELDLTEEFGRQLKTLIKGLGAPLNIVIHIDENYEAHIISAGVRALWALQTPPALPKDEADYFG